jgi:quercetin dioxygenase-like cupin family protein
MRWLAIPVISVMLVPLLEGRAAAQAAKGEVRTLIDNTQVRVIRGKSDALPRLPRGPAVVVALDDAGGEGIGHAVWVEDAAAPNAVSKVHGAVIVVQPRTPRTASPPPSASKPGDAPFTGMSFTPLFENDRVSVLRARMEVGAREGFHTHGSDTIVVHLSGGQIEDTAGGATVVNRWKPGDAEFEAFGSSHSARNLGAAVDVVLVVLKPR